MSNEQTKAAIDWESIEVDFRAGVKSLRMIAEESTQAGRPVTEGAIRKRAKKEKWTRDLSAKIKAKADELVRKEAVRAEVRAANQDTEQATIEANALMQKDIIVAHRKDIGRHRTLALKLLEEIEFQTDNPELFEKLSELMIDPLDDGTPAGANRARALQQAFDKLMSSPGRIDAMKKLSETLKTLIGLEREAFGLDEEKKKTTSDIVEGLKALAATA